MLIHKCNALDSLWLLRPNRTQQQPSRTDKTKRPAHAPTRPPIQRTAHSSTQLLASAESHAALALQLRKRVHLDGALLGTLLGV